MRSRQLTQIVLLTVLTAMTSMLFIACAADGDLHPDLAALAEGDYSRVAGSDAAQMVRSAVEQSFLAEYKALTGLAFSDENEQYSA